MDLLFQVQVIFAIAHLSLTKSFPLQAMNIRPSIMFRISSKTGVLRIKFYTKVSRDFFIYFNAHFSWFDSWNFLKINPNFKTHFFIWTRVLLFRFLLKTTFTFHLAQAHPLPQPLQTTRFFLTPIKRILALEFSKSLKTFKILISF